MRQLRRIALWSTGILAAMTLTGCLSHPTPSNDHAGVLGTNARVGAIQLLSVHVEAPPDPTYSAGADAVVWLTLRNGAHQPDTLTSVTSPVAAQTQIRWDDDCDGTYTTVGQLVLQPAVPMREPGPSAVPIFDAYRLRLVDLQRQVRAGTTVPITFRFQRAGSITVNVPVQPSVPRAEPSTRCQPQPTSSAAHGV